MSKTERTERLCKNGIKFYNGKVYPLGYSSYLHHIWNCEECKKGLNKK